MVKVKAVKPPKRAAAVKPKAVKPPPTLISHPLLGSPSTRSNTATVRDGKPILNPSEQKSFKLWISEIKQIQGLVICQCGLLIKVNRAAPKVPKRLYSSGIFQSTMRNSVVILSWTLMSKRFLPSTWRLQRAQPLKFATARSWGGNIVRWRPTSIALLRLYIKGKSIFEVLFITYY